MDFRLRRPPVPGFTALLAVTTVGIYALLLAGATAAIANATRACTTWPACDGQWFALSSPSLVIVWGHRLTAVVVAALVLAVTALAWVRGERRRVRAVLSVVTVLYPVEIGLGALAATGAQVTTVHLTVGVAIFAGLILALAWSLELETDDANASAGAAESGPETGARAADPEPPSPPEPTGSGSRGPLAIMGGYFRLMKPRLMWLLCLVASAGMALAAGTDLTVRTVVFTLLGGVLAIGASGTFNHVLERDVDRKMERTADRPVPQDAIPARNALAFGVALAVASVATFLQVNALAAGLGLAAILYYSVVYTLVLKPNTVQNTVIGGFAGSLPALIGWAAVTDTVGLPALALAGVIFLWTPAHFYNLALAYREDYERGGFPMLPVVRGERVTRKHILLYLGATLVAAAALSAVTTLGPLYAVTSVAFGAVFLWAVVRLHRERDRSAAFRAFHASNAYLGALLVAVVVDALAL